MKKYYIGALFISLLIFLAVLIFSIEKNTSNSFWRGIGSLFSKKKRVKKEVNLKKKYLPKKNKPNTEINNGNKQRKKINYLIIILDDAGLLKKHYGLINYKYPLNFSIIPEQYYTKHWLNYLKKSSKHEILLHIPMAAYSNAQSGIRPGMSRKSISRFLKKCSGIIRYAKGANNHQGSLATSNAFLMNKFFKIFKKTGLYFIDSITSNKTKAYYYAKKHGVPALKRHYFLDNKKNLSYILKQLKRSIILAKKYGYCVAIGHVTSKNMLKALKLGEKYLKKHNVELIKASRYFKIKKR